MVEWNSFSFLKRSSEGKVWLSARVKYSLAACVLSHTLCLVWIIDDHCYEFLGPPGQTDVFMKTMSQSALRRRRSSQKTVATWQNIVYQVTLRPVLNQQCSLNLEYTGIHNITKKSLSKLPHINIYCICKQQDAAIFMMTLQGRCLLQ